MSMYPMDFHLLKLEFFLATEMKTGQLENE